MKKHSIILLLILLLPFGIQAINFEDLDVDVRVKQQILDSFTLRQSIDQFVKDNSNIPVVTVGGDNTCDYRIGSTKIQDAINEHTTVEIRIATNEVYNENLVINDNSVIIRGRYLNCTDAANNIQHASSQSRVHGVIGANKPVIKIVGNSQRNTIILDNIYLANGAGETENFPGGGISIYQADAQISLTNVMLNNNHSRLGGGIAIIKGNTDIMATGTVLFANSAKSGGGIYCTGSDVSLTMDDSMRTLPMDEILYKPSGITSNNTNGITLDNGGGGIFLTNGCSFINYSGISTDNTWDYAGIAYNTSLNKGGGVYAIDGSLVTLFGHKVCVLSGECMGNDTEPVNLTNNKTINTGIGGGAVIGFGAALNIYAGKVTGNKALLGGHGGGVYLDGNNSTFTTKRLSKACWDQSNCNYYANNTAFGGGAIACTNSPSATMFITNTVFAHNRAVLGTAVSTACDTSIKGSLMYQNGNYGEDKFVVRKTNGSLEIHHTTIADNKSVGAVLGIFGGETNVIASIIHDSSTGPVLDTSNTAATVNIECSILHEDESVTLKPFTIVDDPEFIDRDNHNYHINAQTSPAVDYCYTNTGNYRDMDFEERGWDDTSVTNLHGPYDIGADETYGNDIIFTNGFE
ncbi:hypothetical protein MNBD_GAMMA01-1345 [hydrothermal vent metagenome]|uniref:Extracellular nuclease n=1 Tax=hydrothermal vent metagenome TaxID=652676 RepID=A0A3B0VDJ7_9ZZZZ